MAGTAVHGVLLQAYRRFLEDRFGSGLASEVFKGQSRVDARQTYPDDVFFVLVDCGAQLSRHETDELLREFGAHLLATFHEKYPMYFPAAGARSFLMGLEESIHKRVRDMVAGATPPELSVEDLGGGRLRIQYRSARKLCPLLAGMLDGTGAHYQTPVRHYEETCMRKGAPQCTFVVEVQQTLLPRGKRPVRS